VFVLCSGISSVIGYERRSRVGSFHGSPEEELAKKGNRAMSNHLELYQKRIRAIYIDSMKEETQEERFKRLKRTADASRRHLVHVYLEDERRHKALS